MTFNLSGVCSIPQGFSFKIRNSKTFTMILVKPDGSITVASSSRAEKDALLASYVEGEDLMLMAWTGQYSTDIFELTPENLRDHYR